MIYGNKVTNLLDLPNDVLDEPKPTPSGNNVIVRSGKSFEDGTWERDNYIILTKDEAIEYAGKLLATADANEDIKQSLYSYMCWWSEAYYCAGWLHDLAETMEWRKDTKYQLLRKLAGGTFNDNEEFVSDD